MGRKVKAKLKPYRGLDQNFTQVANSMITYIKDPYTFKIYFYLCMRYNDGFADCSLSEIAEETEISLKKVKTCINELSESGYINKVKYEKNGCMYNKYEVMYDEEIPENTYECYVYTHTYIETGEILYVGKGTNDRAYNFKDRNIKYFEFIHDVGRKNIKVDIVKKFNNSADAFEYERELTIKYKEQGQSKFNIIIGNPYM